MPTPAWRFKPAEARSPAMPPLADAPADRALRELIRSMDRATPGKGERRILRVTLSRRSRYGRLSTSPRCEGRVNARRRY